MDTELVFNIETEIVLIEITVTITVKKRDKLCVT